MLLLIAATSFPFGLGEDKGFLPPHPASGQAHVASLYSIGFLLTISSQLVSGVISLCDTAYVGLLQTHAATSR